MFSCSVMNVINFLLILEYLVLVRFEPVKSAEPPKKLLFIFLEKNSRLFCEDFLVASSLFFLIMLFKKE